MLALGKSVRSGGVLTTPQRNGLGDETVALLLRTAAQERALSRASLQILTQTDEASVLRVALNVVSSLLQVDVAALYLAPHDRASPQCRAIQDRRGVEILPPDQASVDAFAADALRQQTACQVRSWSPPREDGERCRSALAVPLAAEGQPPGVFVVGRSDRKRFRDDHVALLSAVGRHLALALRRVRERESVSIASHEIRTPLAALQGFTELMLTEEAPAHTQRDWLALMNREAVRLGELVDEMQEIAGSGPGRLRLNVRPLDLGEVVCHVARLLDHDGSRVCLLLDQTPPVSADRNKLTQVLTNLLQNALGYSQPEQPVEVQVAARCLAEESDVLGGTEVASLRRAHACRAAVSVTVRDRGVGMTAEELGSAFQPLYRAETSKERRPEGNGLGLAIVAAIVEAHQGTLWARSRAGQGSVFGFCLPAQIPAVPDGAS